MQENTPQTSFKMKEKSEQHRPKITSLDMHPVSFICSHGGFHLHDSEACRSTSGSFLFDFSFSPARLYSVASAH